MHGTKDDGPWGTALLGHTAANGGVYSTVRIPFAKSIKSTITSAESKAGTFWFIIRGVESYPIALGVTFFLCVRRSVCPHFSRRWPASILQFLIAHRWAAFLQQVTWTSRQRRV
jgi:hypothetical protein